MRPQYLAILVSVLLLGLLYGILDNKPRIEAAIPATTSPLEPAPAVSEVLPAAQQQVVNDLLNKIKTASAKEKVGHYKALNNIWYNGKHFREAADCALEVAKLEKTDAAWSIAGASYFMAISQAQQQEDRNALAQSAAESFENAATLNPTRAEYPVNQALVYAENPPADNPMKAVLMLRELENRFPDSPVVYNALGRLAIKTGQWDRAIQRLEKALALDPANRKTICLLADAYAGAGNREKAMEFLQKCK